MIGPIQRLRRQFSARVVAAPMLVVAIGAPLRPDPIAKRIGGTAGVIAIPAMTASAPSPRTRGDAIPLESRRDTRADRGRVLYAAGRAPRDTALAHPHHQPCPDQRLVQATRPGSQSPNS